MKKIKDWQDATHPLTLVLTLQHLKCMKPRKPDACIGHWGAVALPNVRNCHVFLGCTFVEFKSGKILRYVNNSVMRKVAELNDKVDRNDIIRGFKKILEGGKAIVVTLLPPKGVRTQRYQRSEEMKELRRESQRKFKILREGGVPPRSYRTPAMKGLRSGSGLAHTWE